MQVARVVAIEVEAARRGINPFSRARPPPEPSARFGAPVAGADPSLPAVVLSVPTGEVRDALHAAIEGAVARGLILQATLASWASAPDLVATPYEKAVGIGGKDVTRESWVMRYLRAVGEDTIWIGAPLVVRLSEPARKALVSAAAGCEELASGALAVTVGGRERRSAVEEAFEALLPAAADFVAFKTAIWGRP